MPTLKPIPISSRGTNSVAPTENARRHLSAALTHLIDAGILICHERRGRELKGLIHAQDLVHWIIGELRSAPAAACRVCGCTQNNACKGGCSWIEADLCSSCSPQANA
jgi:hypothetical protein